MSRIIDDMIAETIRYEHLRIAQAMIDEGSIPFELISKYTGLTMEELEEFAARKGV